MGGGEGIFFLVLNLANFSFSLIFSKMSIPANKSYLKVYYV